MSSLTDGYAKKNKKTRDLRKVPSSVQGCEQGSVGVKLALRPTLQAFCKQVNILSQKSNNFKNACVYRASPELLHIIAADAPAHTA